MINEEWQKKKATQNDAPFVPFYDMLAVIFVRPDKMADVSIAGLQWFIPIPQFNHTGSHRPKDYRSKPYLHTQKKNIRFWRKISNPMQSYELWGKQLFLSHFSRLLQHAIEKGWGPILYTKITLGPHGAGFYNRHTVNWYKVKKIYPLP